MGTTGIYKIDKINWDKYNFYNKEAHKIENIEFISALGDKIKFDYLGRIDSDKSYTSIVINNKRLKYGR